MLKVEATDWLNLFSTALSPEVLAVLNAEVVDLLNLFSTRFVQCRIVSKEELVRTEIPEGEGTIPNTTLSPPE